MDGILKILKKENGPRASSALALELNTIIFKRVYWYMQQLSGERLQERWSSGSIFYPQFVQTLAPKPCSTCFIRILNKKCILEINLINHETFYEPVICIPGSPGTGE